MWISVAARAARPAAWPSGGPTRACWASTARLRCSKNRGTLAIPSRLEFEQAEIGTWVPRRPIDLIVSNAALHWVGDHEALFTRLVAMLSSAGCLAVQMPYRFNTPSHAAIEESAGDPRWCDLLKGVGLNRESARPLLWYAAHLQDLGLAVNAWETTYIHVLAGENPVLDWLKGTALRPLLARLDEAAAAQFLDDLGGRLQAAYPPRKGVTLFPMPRIFFVATRS